MAEELQRSQGMGTMAIGALTAFGLGFGYFIAALPAGAAAGAPLWVAAIAAWAGYTAGALVVVAGGVPVRDWVARKFRIEFSRDPKRLFWRVWGRAGLLGLGLIAPVTVGPQIGGILALGIGERPLRVVVALSAGVIPWCTAFALMVHWGLKIAR